MIDRPDIDAVIVATPDHWHATSRSKRWTAAKTSTCEKPMCHTIEEAKQLAATVQETKRVLQVGSQTTSADQWHKAKKAIADGMIGKMLMSQGSYHRNSIEGEWNWPIDADAGPDGKGENYIDWKMWLGSRAQAPLRRRPLLPLPQVLGLFGRHRHRPVLPRGRAAEHLLAGAAVPAAGQRARAASTEFKDEREVPDTFHLMADFPQGHSLVLSSSMANSQHIPGLIRGHEGTIIMVDHGQVREADRPHHGDARDRSDRQGRRLQGEVRRQGAADPGG